MKRTGLLAAILVILLANGLALIGVATNRAGEAVETIALTERELPLQNVDQENSGVYLRLDLCRREFSTGDPSRDLARLQEVGFDLRIPAGTRGSEVAIMPRTAYVALELEGDAWQQWLQREQKQLEFDRRQDPAAPQRTSRGALPERDPRLAPHLAAVDVAKSIQELRGRYPDQSKYLIVKAILVLRVEDVKDPASGAVTDHKFTGNVTEILPSVIHVPLPHARLLSPLKPQSGQEPRYTVTLKYGRNLEPWIDSVRLH